MEHFVKVYWSAEDGCFLAEVSDLPGCVADGTTETEARQNAAESAERWIKMARYLGREIPAPSSFNSATLQIASGERLTVPLSFDGDREVARLEIDGINYHLERVRKSDLLAHYKVDDDPDYDPQADDTGFCYLLAPYSAS